MSLVIPKKPARWALSPGMVDPSWRWAWRDLVGAWPFWDGGGGQIGSLVYPADGVALTGSAFWSSDHAGMGLRVNAANLAGGIIKVPSLAMRIADAVTALWCGVVYSDGNGIGSPALVSLVPNSSDQSPFVSYGLARDAGSSWNLSASWNNGTFQTLTVTNGISADGYGKDRVFAFAYDSHSAIGYRDGVQIGSSTTGLGTITYGTDPELLIGRHAVNTSANTDSLTYLVMIWHRKLTAAEHALISRDPFGPFRMADQAGVVYAVPSAGGTTILGSVALASTASLSGTGIVTKLGQAALSAMATLSASATRTVLGAANLASTTSLAASGLVARIGAAAISAISTVAASAGSTVGAAMLTATATVAAAGTITRLAAANLRAAASVSAASLREALGAATISATATMAASGVASRLGTTALSVSATVRVVVASAAIETVLARTRTLTVLATARTRSVLATVRTLAVIAVKRS